MPRAQTLWQYFAEMELRLRGSLISEEKRWEGGPGPEHETHSRQGSVGFVMQEGQPSQGCPLWRLLPVLTSVWPSPASCVLCLRLGCREEASALSDCLGSSLGP